MKKCLLIAVMAIVSVAYAAAQPRAIGANLGGGIGFSYQHGFGEANMLDVAVYTPIASGQGKAWGISGVVTYDWIDPFNAPVPWNEKGEWHWYMGVGGGGGNAVNHMYREGIHDVTFVLCNTDNQALNDSPVPVHLQLGKEGLGAGNKPEKARQAAEETIEDIRNMLNDGTRMAFITAGMGGGTGTGAAPVIARVSKELGILTVGIVTIPFRFEGDRKIDQALDGVEEMSKHVDALLVINNERLREIYPELSVLDAFGKADDTLPKALLLGSIGNTRRCSPACGGAVT